MYNRFIAVGYISKSPSLKFTETSEVCNFGFVTSRKYGEGKEENFWAEVVAWGRLAEIAATFKKGDLILIEGRLMTKEDKFNGSKTRVIAEKFRVLKRKENETTQKEGIPEGMPEEETIQEPF